MRVVELLVNTLDKLGIRDAFGIPGGVILDFIYTLERCKSINLHLCCHEQSCGYAAIGYALTNNGIGLAYATQGPGILNMITPITEAYVDRIPLIVITAHKHKREVSNVRLAFDQEIDVKSILYDITKSVCIIDNISQAIEAIAETMPNCKRENAGPIVLDFLESVFSEELEYPKEAFINDGKCLNQLTGFQREEIESAIEESQHPVFLVGDGLRKPSDISYIKKVVDKYGIPLVSSKYVASKLLDSTMYMGYIGSHGMRCSNYIISSADLIIVIGNRLGYPLDSSSYACINDVKKIWVEIDDGELERNIPNTLKINCTLANVLDFINYSMVQKRYCDWTTECRSVKRQLWSIDEDRDIVALSNIWKKLDSKNVVCDVGNNELIFSSALMAAGKCCSTIYSKRLKTVGCALPKSIGVAFATSKPVLCVSGDQGFQFASQELHTIKKYNLPIIILIINNNASGMLRDEEAWKYDKKFLHTTVDSGYSVPDLRKISESYGLVYYSSGKIKEMDDMEFPCLIDYNIQNELMLRLPKGNKMYELVPNRGNSDGSNLLT